MFLRFFRFYYCIMKILKKLFLNLWIFLSWKVCFLEKQFLHAFQICKTFCQKNRTILIFSRSVLFNTWHKKEILFWKKKKIQKQIMIFSKLKKIKTKKQLCFKKEEFMSRFWNMKFQIEYLAFWKRKRTPSKYLFQKIQRIIFFAKIYQFVFDKKTEFTMSFKLIF